MAAWGLATAVMASEREGEEREWLPQAPYRRIWHAGDLQSAAATDWNSNCLCTEMLINLIKGGRVCGEDSKDV